MTNHPLAELAAKLESRPVLVTGASGGIGRRLVQVLSESPVPVRALLRQDRLSGAETARGDLTRPETLAGACSGIHTIFHLASYSPAKGDPRPEEHPLHQQVTVEGTRNLLRVARSTGVERIVFASSTRVLDGSTTLYAQSKRSAEKLLSESPISTAVLRLPPVYVFTRRGFVAEMLEKALAGRLPPFPDFGDRRSLVHLDDAVQSLLLAALAPGLNGSWTVTDLQDYSIHRISEAILTALGKEPGRPWPPVVFHIAALAGEVLQRLLHRPMPLDLERLDKLRRPAWFDGAPFAEAAGYRPLYTLEKALPRMLAMLAQESDEAS